MIKAMRRQVAHFRSEVAAARDAMRDGATAAIGFREQGLAALSSISLSNIETSEPARQMHAELDLRPVWDLGDVDGVLDVIDHAMRVTAS
jgi:hypothetical protein